MGSIPTIKFMYPETGEIAIGNESLKDGLLAAGYEVMQDENLGLTQEEKAAIDSLIAEAETPETETPETETPETESLIENDENSEVEPSTEEDATDPA